MGEMETKENALEVRVRRLESRLIISEIAIFLFILNIALVVVQLKTSAENKGYYKATSQHLEQLYEDHENALEKAQAERK